MKSVDYQQYYKRNHWGDFGNEILEMFSNLDSVTLLGMYGSGNEFFLNHVYSYLCDYTNSDFTMLKINAELYSDISHLEIANVFLFQLADIVKGEIKNPIARLEKALSAIVENGSKIFFIIDQIHHWFKIKENLKFLKSLSELTKHSSAFFFTTNYEIMQREEVKEKILGDLYSNIEVVPLYNLGQTTEMLQVNSKVYNWEIDEKFYNDIYQLSGGNPGMVKYIHRYVHSNDKLPEVNNIFEDSSLRYKFEKQCNEIESIIGHKVSSNFLNEMSKKNEVVLKKLNIIDQENNLFSPLLHEFILHYRTANTDKDTPDFEKTLTIQEKRVFDLLQDKKGSIASLEEIGDSLWNDDSNTKYSLWSIYKVISNLRKKIDRFGFEIKNYRGRGYGLVINPET